ncbi:MAG: hypothetical protein ACODAA_08405, partial [Gemmatimonadota bacterium]
YLIRYLLEQTHGQIQQIVIDPEGEFSTLRERFDYVIASADPDDGDVSADPTSAKLLCRQLVELGASAVLDIYELDDDERQEFVGRFLTELIGLPKELWRPILIVVDEAHELAPQDGSEPPSLRPMKRLVSKGRKRGFGAVFATQRISKLNKDAADLLNNLVGYTGLDNDVKRAGDMLGFSKARREELRRLEAGEFYAFGPAISKTVRKVRSGDIQTYHPQAGEVVPPTPPPPAKIQALLGDLEDLPERAAEEERTIAALEAQVGRLERELREAERDGPARDLADLEVLAEQRVEAATAELRRQAERQHRAFQVMLQHVASALGGLAGQASALRADVEQAIENGRPAADDAGPGRPVITPPHMEERERSGRDAPANDEAPRPEMDPDLEDLTDAGADPELAQRILDTLAAFEALGVPTLDRKSLAVLVDYAPTTKLYRRTLAVLNERDLAGYPESGAVALTPDGGAIANAPATPPTHEAIVEAWRRKLDDAQRRMLDALLDAHPTPIPREELAAAAGYAPTTKAFRGGLSQMRGAFGLVHYPKTGHVALTDLLFPDGIGLRGRVHGE